MPAPPVGPAIRPAQTPRRQSVRFARLRSISALMLREMSARYGATPGGYAWAVAEPLGMILLLSFGFSLLVRSPSLGTSFLLFYATGYLPYALFNRMTAVVGGALKTSRTLLQYPAARWIDAVAARAALYLLTDTLVAYLILSGILIVTDTRAVLEMKPILAGFAAATLLGCGMGLVNAVLVGFLPVWQTIWNILTRPLFLASGIIWIYEDLPPMAQDVLWWNPLVHIGALVRTGFYITYDPAFLSGLLMSLPGMILVTFGLLLLRRFHLEILSRR